MHKSNRCFKLELKWAVFSHKLPLKSEKVIQNRKKLLERLKVAPNLKSCSKVAEQLMYSPSLRSVDRESVFSGYPLGHVNLTNL